MLRRIRRADHRVVQSLRRATAAAPATLTEEDIAELTLVAATIAGTAAKVAPRITEMDGATILLKVLIEAREKRYRRGDVDVPVARGPRPAPGNPVDCDVCRKPVQAGNEILSPWGDWIHNGFCYTKAIFCREMGGRLKPPGYVFVPRP